MLGELREKEGRRKRRDAFPCEPRLDEQDELLLRQHRSDLANRKELGHVRAPVPCPVPKSNLMVDRAAGERPGLVDGDYVVVELATEGQQGKRVYANVVLRGLKGMHLPELGPLRERKGTWKFCLYQALVALLAKTQLRYRDAFRAVLKLYEGLQVGSLKMNISSRIFGEKTIKTSILVCYILK